MGVQINCEGQNKESTNEKKKKMIVDEEVRKRKKMGLTLTALARLE
jgi:hypothetical protein